MHLYVCWCIWVSSSIVFVLIDGYRACEYFRRWLIFSISLRQCSCVPIKIQFEVEYGRVSSKKPYKGLEQQLKPPLFKCKFELGARY